MNGQRRKRNGTWAHSDHARKSKSEKLAFQAAEVELMKKAKPEIDVYASTKVNPITREVEANLIKAEYFEARGNRFAARVYREEAERIRRAG